MTQIYGLAFRKDDLGAYTLRRLKNIDCCYQIWPNNLESYLTDLLHNKPEYILGLGIYSGRDQDKIRIEKNAPINSGMILRGEKS